MKLLINICMPLMLLFAFARCQAQIPNAKTDIVMVYGNCGMCEKNIEKAAYLRGEAKADWDRDTKMAQITYDSSKTTADVVLQRIAAAGYDSDKFKAPAEAYSNLAECCQYERPKKAEAAMGMTEMPVMEEHSVATEVSVKSAQVAEPSEGMVKKQASTTQVAATNPLSDVYAAYFGLKDALVSTNGEAASTQAATLSQAIDKVNMNDLSAPQHNTWMQYKDKLSTEAASIQGMKKTDQQREHFVILSKNMYEVMKVVKPETTVYLDNCPMYNEGKGADWLSKEKGIKNPYYGKQMLSCGNVKEIIE